MVYKGKNLKRETESLLIAAQNNAIRINYIKSKIDNTQQNSNCRFTRDRDEIVNPIISECSKLARKKVQDEVQLGEKVKPPGIVQEVQIWSSPLTRICTRKRDHIYRPNNITTIIL